MDGPALKKRKMNITDSQHSKRLVNSLQSFNYRQNFVDTCFVCAQGHRVYAHKLLLVSVSNQMKGIFLELPDNMQMITVHLPDIKGRILELVIQFLYEGSVRVNKNEYKEFQEIMDLLGIVLTTPNDESAARPSPESSQPPPQPVQQATAAPPQQLVYVPVSQASGQVQYMLATPAPGQMIQGSLMTPAVQTQASPQPVMIAQPSAQVVQSGGQMVTSPAQQNMVQIVQQNTPQMVTSDQMVQCSSQMVMAGNQQGMMNNNQMQVIQGTQQVMQNQVIQGTQQVMQSQPAIMNTSQMQVGMQNQVAQSYTNQTVQQRPQYVMSSAGNQMTPSRRAPVQYSQVQNTGQRGVVRGRSVQQPQPQPQQNNVRTRRVRGPVPVNQNRPMITPTRTVQRARPLTQ